MVVVDRGEQWYKVETQLCLRLISLVASYAFVYLLSTPLEGSVMVLLGQSLETVCVALAALWYGAASKPVQANNFSWYSKANGWTQNFSRRFA